MKAKIKSTGEIINIAEYAKVKLESCDSYGNPIELGFDEVEVLNDKSDCIDWGQRRYEIAKELMNGICMTNNTVSFEQIAKWSIEGADALIAKLKKGGNNAND